MSDSLAHVTFRPAIEAKAAEMGRAPTSQQIETLELVLQSLGRVDDDAGVLVVDDDGQVIGLFDYLGTAVAKFPPKTVPEPVAPSREPKEPAYVKVTVGAFTSYRRATDGIVAINESLNASHEARLLAEAKQWLNPWSPQHLNRTRQVVLARLLPNRAAQFKAQAGAR